MKDSSRYAGMTVNERFFAAGLLSQFDQAINTENPNEAINILMQLELSAEQAQETVGAILKDPKRYGYPKHYA